MRHKVTLVPVPSYEVCEVFKNNFFTGHPWMIASEPKKTVRYEIIKTKLVKILLFTVRFLQA